MDRASFMAGARALWLISFLALGACAPDDEDNPSLGRDDSGAVVPSGGGGGSDAGGVRDGAVAPPGSGGQLDGGTGPGPAPAADAATSVRDGGGAVGPDATQAGSDASVASDGSVVAVPDAAVSGDAAVTPGSAEATLVPHASWTCGMPEGIPPPQLGAPAFDMDITIGTAHDVGKTKFGKRTLNQLGAGTFKGPMLDATLLSGGFEQVVQLDNGVVELEQVLMLRSGSANMYLRVCGVAASAADPVRVVLDLEAPNSSHRALQAAKLAGVRTLSADGKKITLRIYDVGQVKSSGSTIRIDKPAGVPSQTWECATLSGQNGAEQFKEVVQIGGSVSVGAGKRGNRNVIPITGGTVTGKVKASILPLGADFQLTDNGFVLDARYVLKSEQGELVIVRNCGPASKLVPVFETRTDGTYAWLNEDKWLSSSPGIGLGTVTLTMYEKR
jgi:hypothetical protein